MTTKWYQINITLQDTNIFNGYLITDSNNIVKKLYHISDKYFIFNLLNEPIYNPFLLNTSIYNLFDYSLYDNTYELPINGELHTFQFDEILFNSEQIYVNSGLESNGSLPDYYIPLVVNSKQVPNLIENPPLIPQITPPVETSSSSWYEIDIILENENIFDGYLITDSNNTIKELYHISDRFYEFNLLKQQVNSPAVFNIYDNVFEISIYGEYYTFEFTDILFSNDIFNGKSAGSNGYDIPDEYYIPITINLNKIPNKLGKPPNVTTLTWYKIKILADDIPVFRGYVSLENNVAKSLYDIIDFEGRYNLLNSDSINNNNFKNIYNVFALPVNDILKYFMFDSILFNNPKISNDTVLTNEKTILKSNHTPEDDSYYIPIVIILNETAPLISKPSCCPVVNSNNKKIPKSLLYSKLLQQNLGKRSSNKINFANLNINPFGSVNGMAGIKTPIRNVF